MALYSTYSVAQMKDAERRAEEECGISLATLMDNAGKGLAQAAWAMVESTSASVWVFCGSGNNGGDGYVCATELGRRGAQVTVFGVAPDDLPAGSLVEAAANSYRRDGGDLREATLGLDLGDGQPDLIVDALLGTGVSRPVTGLYAHLIDVINDADCPVLACDIPSGVNADTGEIMGTAVKATRSVVLGLAKHACLLAPGSDCFGEIELCDIGTPTR